MIGGLNMPLSRFALCAVVGLTIGAYAVPAKAADLGGDCCADLEERVAELEATTVRKGNRKVSVTLYGHVDKAVMFWDDGVESNTYVVDNDHNSTRFGFKGKAKIAHGWSAGYKIEIEIDADQSSAELDQTKDTSGDGPSVRHSYMFIKSKTYGEVSWGYTSGATDDITHKGYVAKNTNATRPDFHWNRDFVALSGGVSQGFTFGALCGDTFDKDACFDSTGRANVIRYDTPKIAGFQVKTAWGNDDFWDVGLYWSGKAGDFKLSATVGYRHNNLDGGHYDGGLPGGIDIEEDKVAGSAGIIHVPTGLFVQGAWFHNEIDDSPALLTDESNGWHIEAGIQQKWFSLGKTTIWGEYAEVNDGFIGECAVDGSQCFESSELTRWGVGVTQAIDAAAMELYVLYQNTDGEYDDGVGKVKLDEFDSVIAGGIIKF